jgi:Neuraminidase (sialidase)
MKLALPRITSLLIYLLFVRMDLGAEEPLMEKQVLFSERSAGFTLYRIPGIIVTGHGTVLVYCEARKHSVADRGEIEIYMRRSTDAGRTFSPAQQVAHLGPRLPRNPHMPDAKKLKDMGSSEEQTVNNPVAIVEASNTVHLIYCVEYRHCFHIHSEDDGLTWSKPIDITYAFEQFRSELDWQVIATGPGHAIATNHSRLIVPFWMATYAKSQPLKKAVGVIYSDDHGLTWMPGDIALRDAGEPNIAQVTDGRILITARNSHQKNRRILTYSKDGRFEWGEPLFAEELLEPGCMAGIVAHPGTATIKGPCLLFSHPNTVEREHSSRRDLTIHMSRDDGSTWPYAKLLQAGPSAYSDLAVLPDGTILCLYESGRDPPIVQRKRDWAYATLTLARFNLAWFYNKQD